jgi:hypothetical protein
MSGGCEYVGGAVHAVQHSAVQCNALCKVYDVRVVRLRQWLSVSGWGVGGED